MGYLAKLVDAKRELEELYQGVPDESVNLTFQDLAELKQQEGAHSISSENKRTCSPIMDPIGEVLLINPKAEQGSTTSTLTKLPSLDIKTALQPSTHHHHHLTVDDTAHHLDVHGSHSGLQLHGVPHSNICTICSVYIYIFRHRCLVCGRVYCRQCVSVGMGEMTEGRKCVDCLGRRFSQRYIQRAGKVGCCMRYPSMVKHQELTWAAKGLGRSGESGYDRSTVMSRSRSPVRTPTRSNASSSTSTIVNSPCSVFSPTSHHPIPF